VLEGGVSFDEFERSILTTMSCIQAEGIVVYGPYEEQGGRSLSFDYGGLPAGANEGELRAQDTIAQSCMDEYLSAVSLVYAESVAPSGAELREREAKRRACARGLGYLAPEDMIPGEFYTLVTEHEDLSVCIERYP
jgi:hypothetical protein